MSTFHKAETIRSFDLGCSALYDVTKKQRYVVRDGVKYPASVKYTKSSHIEHKTETGVWMRKAQAVRQGLKTTGETRQVFKRGNSYYVATVSHINH